MSRQCSRTGCPDRATATLSYDYGAARAWLCLLTADRDPHNYDLCARHAAMVSVPRGWCYADLRADTAVRDLISA